MNKFVKFFHEIMNPHCEHCEHERMELYHHERCKACDVFQQQLAVANNHIDELLNKIGKVEEETTAPVNETRQVIQTRHVPWTVKRQMLETESKAKAIALSKMAKPDEVTENLEKELGIKDASNG